MNKTFPGLVLKNFAAKVGLDLGSGRLQKVDWYQLLLDCLNRIKNVPISVGIVELNEHVDSNIDVCEYMCNK